MIILGCRLGVSILVLLEPPLIQEFLESVKGEKNDVSILVLLEPPLIRWKNRQRRLMAKFQSLFYWNLLSYNSAINGV